MGKKRKKKSRFGYYLYAFVVLILTIAIITLATLIVCHVQETKINGNTYSDSDKIMEWLKEDPYVSNSIYAYVKFKTDSYEKPAYLENVDVKLRAPWILEVKVKEKEMIGYTKFKGENIYFDKEGLVLLKSTKVLEGVPYIEGIELKDVKQYEKLQVKNEKVFLYIMNVTEEVKNNDLKPDHIVWENDSMDLYFGDVCVKLGKVRYDEKVRQLPPILKKLDGKKGTLHMEHYNETSTNISFTQSDERNE